MQPLEHVGIRSRTLTALPQYARMTFPLTRPLAPRCVSGAETLRFWDMDAPSMGLKRTISAPEISQKPGAKKGDPGYHSPAQQASPAADTSRFTLPGRKRPRGLPAYHHDSTPRITRQGVQPTARRRLLHVPPAACRCGRGSRSALSGRGSHPSRYQAPPLMRMVQLPFWTVSSA